MISPFGWGFKLIMKLGLIVNTCCISVCSFYLFRVTLMSVSMIKHDVYLCNVLVYIVLYTLIQKKCRVLLHCAPRERYALDHEHSLRNHSFGKPVGRFLSISFFFFWFVGILFASAIARGTCSSKYWSWVGSWFNPFCASSHFRRQRETIFFCLSTFVSCCFVTFCLANM